MTLQDMRNNKPTEEWRESLEEGDELFTEESITESERALDDFIDGLIALKDDKNEDKIMELVAKVVSEFNTLNDKYDYYIETLEREDLCDFIMEAAQTAGLETDEDITEEWREW
ncbi:MAG: hypothetical protein LIR50_09635 [Bacillota bacterium]|nr:hypothetical protein [Bacillota bacterium]